MSVEVKLKLRDEMCPDEIIGVLKSNGKVFEKFEEHKDYKDIQIRTKEEFINKYPEYKNYKCMVILLESPHIDEFDISSKIKFRPAYGKTGKKNIRNLLHEKLNRVMSKEYKKNNYIIFLVNSIQYQCSLGVQTKYFRDYVWLYKWKEKIVREYLIERLKAIKPDLIMNCCTMGKHHNMNINGEYISFLKGQTNIDNSILKGIGFYVDDSIKTKTKIKDNREVIWEGDIDKITLKSLVSFSIEKGLKGTNIKVNDKLTHPFNWRG